jgi:hypothetical protein
MTKRTAEEQNVLDTMTKLVEDIAKEALGIDTLKTQNSDRLDFHEVSVWQLEAALKMALAKGMEIGVKVAA